jgi:hypothetical protein
MIWVSVKASVVMRGRSVSVGIGESIGVGEEVGVELGCVAGSVGDGCETRVVAIEVG